jgi:hypothetical protein
MKRSQALRLLQRNFDFRWGKGDHCHFYDQGRFVYGLAVGGRSNGTELPRTEVRKIKQLLGVDNEN